MRKIYCLFAVLSVAIMCSCSSSKSATKSPAADVEVIVPCSGVEFMTSPEYFRASAMAISNSQEIAGQKAMSAARAKLAASIQTTVKTVTDNYTSSYEINQQEEARGRFQALTREVVDQKLTGIKTICQKVMQSPDGKFKCYVAIELAGESIAQEMNSRVSGDEKLRTDFEYEKFKQAFDQEMANEAAKQ